MSRRELASIAAVFLCTVGTVAGILAVESHRRTRQFTAELSARQPDYGNWYPGTLVVPYGQPVRLMLRNIDTVSHGFALPDFKVAVREIKAGEVEVVQFTPDKRGTFPFMCTVWCSPRHLEMRGKLVVE